MWVYQAIGQWAKNNGKTVIPDPRGLSEVNWLRRSEAMISAILHQRDSDTFAPDVTQFAGLLSAADYRKLVNNQHQKEVIPEVIEKLESFKRDLWDDVSGHAFSKEETYNIRVNNLAIASAMLAFQREPALGTMGVDSDARLHAQVNGQDQVLAESAGPEGQAFADVVGGADRVQTGGVGYSTAQRAVVTAQLLGWKPGVGVARLLQLGMQSLAGAESVRSGDRAHRGSLGGYGQSRLVEGLNSAELFYQSVYHGSPYRFDNFSLEHMGKGEGAQAYGWGLYFAGKRGVAEFYRQSLADFEMRVGGAEFDNNNPAHRAALHVHEAEQNGETRQDVIARLERSIKDLDSRGKTWADEEAAVQRQELQLLKTDTPLPKYEQVSTGQLYEADIPDGGYLLWDKPLSEQPEDVRQAIERAMSDPRLDDYSRTVLAKGGVGAALYNALGTDDNLGGTPEAASRYLNSLGINGIQYLDGDSRGAGAYTVTLSVKGKQYSTTKFQDKGQADAYAAEKRGEGFEASVDIDGDFNYVLFDDAAIDIVNTYYQNKGQQARGSFNPDTTVMTLLKNADLSTVLHELGHYFFEADIALASELVSDGRTFGEDTHTEGERALLAAVKVKPSLLGEAMAVYLKDPRGVTRMVHDASPYMAGRMANEVGIMTEAINDILLNPTLIQKGRDWTMRHAYFLQSGIDNVMSPVIWTAAYNQYQAEGHNHEDAVRLADGVVRTTQGSTMPEDISRIEGGNAFVRLFTQFAGYFNMQANLLGTEFANVMQQYGLRKGAGTQSWLGRSAWNRRFT